MEVDVSELEDCKKQFFTNVKSVTLKSVSNDNAEPPIRIQSAGEINCIMRDASDIERENSKSFVINTKLEVRDEARKFISLEAELNPRKDVTHKPTKKTEIDVSSKKKASPKQSTILFKSKSEVDKLKSADVNTKRIEENDTNSNHSSVHSESNDIPKKTRVNCISDNSPTGKDLADSDVEENFDSSPPKKKKDVSEDEMDTKTNLNKPGKKRIARCFDSDSEEEILEQRSKPNLKEARTKAKVGLDFDDDELPVKKSQKKRSKNVSESEEEELQIKASKSKKKLSDDEESPVKKKTGKRSVKNKGSRNMSQSEDEESPVKKKVKKRRSKKVASSDEDDEAKPVVKKPLAPFDPKELVEVDEMHEDEDGYLVTTKVKRVETKTNVKEIEDEEKEQKPTVKKLDKPLLSKKSSSAAAVKKGQKSIMSFFKPLNK